MSFETIIQTITTHVAPTLWERLSIIVGAPARYPEMIWILTPMIFTLLLMTFYFGRYRREELGWNTAVGNSLVLIFVSIDLYQRIYPDFNPLRAFLVFWRTLFAGGLGAEGILPGIVAGAIFMYAIVLLTADFFHWIPKKIAFFISSGLPINVLAYFGIIFVYSRTAGHNILPLDGYSLCAFILLFTALYIFLKFLQLIEPKSDDVKELAKEAPSPSHKAGEKADVRRQIIQEPLTDEELEREANKPIFIPEDDPARKQQ